jgi:hypothetical protein
MQIHFILLKSFLIMVEVRLGVYGVVWIFIHMVFLRNVCMFVVSMPVHVSLYYVLVYIPYALLLL